jgi:hypothetical protein
MGAWSPLGGASTKQEAMIDRHARIVRNARVEFRKLGEDGGAVLLNLDTAAYHGLNETGSLIWETVGDGKALDELVAEVAAAFEQTPPSLLGEVAAFIEELVERDLLRVDAQVPVGDGRDAPDAGQRA